MSFERYRTQVFIERHIGCHDLQKWNSYSQKFESLAITNKTKVLLLNELMLDAADLYFKGIFSIADAINSVSNGRHSWAVIKLYYSIFYLMRCFMAAEGYAVLKNKGIYTLKLEVGEIPVRRDQGTYRGENIRGDHKTTIATFVNLFQGNDILQSNKVNQECVYDWFMNLRDQVNYRERIFHEPSPRYFYKTLFDKAQAKKQVETYINDEDHVYCFDEDHCALAVPLKLALMTREKLYNFIDFEPFESDKKAEIEKLVKVIELDSLAKFKKIYDFGRANTLP